MKLHAYNQAEGQENASPKFHRAILLAWNPSVKLALPGKVPLSVSGSERWKCCAGAARMLVKWGQQRLWTAKLGRFSAIHAAKALTSPRGVTPVTAAA